MKPIDMSPGYSTKDVPGRCIKCLAEQELDSCLRELLREETDSQELLQKYELIINFLESPESQKLCAESEKMLADGKEVTLRIHFENDTPRYELKTD